MKVILAATMLLAGLAGAPALADKTIATSQTHCSRSNQGYACHYEYDGAYSNTTTYCASNRRSRHCETVTTAKPEPVLIIPEPPQPPPEGQVDPALYGGLTNPNDPAELRRQRERGAREDGAARATSSAKRLLIH